MPTINAPEQCDDATASFSPYLAHITQGSIVRDVDPSACIPLWLARGCDENAIERLINLLTGTSSQRQNAPALSGMVSGAPTCIIVPLIGELSYIVTEHLEELHGSSDDVESERNIHKEWFGVIDGCQFHGALMRLRVKFPSKWMSLEWKVICVRPGLDLAEYRKLAIVQNERNRQEYHFEATSFDMIRSLRTIHDELQKERSKASRRGTINHREVAQLYDGGDHTKNTTVKQAVSVATRLSLRCIDAIGTVINMSCAELILNNCKLNDLNLTSTSAILAEYDCRVFRRFLSLSTLRGAKNFMNAVKDKKEDAQVNTIFRARHWCEYHDYRSVNPMTLSEQFDLAKQALYEEQKFLALLNQSVWPKNMETTRENLLMTTVYDSELHSNRGNTGANDILSPVWKCFKRLYPARAKGIENQMENKRSGVPDSSSSAVDEPPIAAEVPSNNNVHSQVSEEEKKKQEEERARRKLAERHASMRAKADRYLKEICVETHALDFNDFRQNVWKSTKEHVDLVLSVIPPMPENSDSAPKVASFCKAVLKLGSYAFLIVDEAEFSRFKKAFHDAGFKVCNHGFNILYDTSTLRSRRSPDFPQRQGELGFIAKTMGTHPSGFQPDFVSHPLGASNESTPAAFASLTNVESCIFKLMKPQKTAAIFPHERSVSLLSRIIRMFSPSEGSVMDPFGGPLTTALACLQTGRKCTSMDSDSDAFRYAQSRLRIFAVPNATLKELEIYADPMTDHDSDQNPSQGTVATEDTANTARSSQYAGESSGVSPLKKRKTQGSGANEAKDAVISGIPCSDPAITPTDDTTLMAPQREIRSRTRRTSVGTSQIVNKTTSTIATNALSVTTAASPSYPGDSALGSAQPLQHREIPTVSKANEKDGNATNIDINGAAALLSMRDRIDGSD